MKAATTKLDPTEIAAAQAAWAVGFDGSNPQAICGLLFALADVLTVNGHTLADVATMYENVAGKLYGLAARRIEEVNRTRAAAKAAMKEPS